MAKNNTFNIPYNKPLTTGDEERYIGQVLENKKFSGSGFFTESCHSFFQKELKFKNCFLTHSCSSALEMAASLCDFNEGDEVILPSFGYVTMASAFQNKGAKLVFVDSKENQPHICPEAIRKSITKATKALIIVHYGGNSCDMKSILDIVTEYELLLIEDCAHAINATYENQYLGTFGNLSTFSFHETKNIHSGEGGLLVVNDEALVEKATMIWQEGTNRTDFNKGLVTKYEWMCQGSSYQPSELTAAFLYGQIQYLNEVTQERIAKWNIYFDGLSLLAKKGIIELPLEVNEGHNAHIFYIRIVDPKLRTKLISFLNKHLITSVFHYLPLHLSPYWLENHDTKTLENAEHWSAQILRLPLYHTLTKTQQEYIILLLSEFISEYE